MHDDAHNLHAATKLLCVRVFIIVGRSANMHLTSSSPPSRLAFVCDGPPVKLFARGVHSITTTLLLHAHQWCHLAVADPSPVPFRMYGGVLSVVYVCVRGAKITSYRTFVDIHRHAEIVSCFMYSYALAALPRPECNNCCSIIE